jgi:hypothetical protein
MNQSRRNFIGAAASAAVTLACGAAALAAQTQAPFPPAPMPGNPLPNWPLGGDSLPEPRLSTADRLKKNQAQIKKDVARLKAAVEDLQKNFDSNNTTTVLSLAAVRKTDEIERLAREIRGLVRG